MNTLEAINKRRSIRSFNGEALTEGELGAILQAAEAAPIGRGMYDTMHLTVVQDKALLATIDRACAELFGDPKLTPLYGAPTLVVVSTQVPGDMPSANVAFSNAAIVVHNMTLAATELGVGACHIWGAVRAINVTPDILAALDLPEGFSPCCAAALGHFDGEYTERDIPADRIATSFIG